MTKTTTLLMAAAAIGVLGLGGLAVYSTPPADAAISSMLEASETVTFEIENMTCAMCPVTVRTAMNRVDGVHSVDVDFDSKTAVVNFDPAVASMDEIAQASTQAGYPAHPSGAPHDDSNGQH